MNTSENILLQVILVFSAISVIGWSVVGNALRLTPESSKLLGLANLLLGAGVFFLIKSLQSPSELYFFSSDFCLLCSIWLFRSGSSCLMNGRKQRSFWLAIPILSAILIIAYLYTIKDSNWLRVLVFSVVAAWEMAYCFYESLNSLKSNKYKAYADLVISTPILIAAILLLGRGAIAITMESSDWYVKNAISEQFDIFLWMMLIIVIILNLSAGGLSATRLILEIKTLSERDHLTGVLNRQAIEQRLDVEIERFNRNNEPMSCIFMDIDKFKNVNDTYGHDVGDEAIKHLATKVRHEIRPTDSIGRYGGEEFLVILANTNIDGAKELANRIRKTLENSELCFKGINLKLTASFGASTFIKGESKSSVVDRADKAMYRAKQLGRNRVEIA